MVFAIDPQAARAAFVVVAHAVGMHVLPDDFDEMRKASWKKRNPAAGRSGVEGGHLKHMKPITIIAHDNLPN